MDNGLYKIGRRRGSREFCGNPLVCKQFCRDPTAATGWGEKNKKNVQAALAISHRVQAGLANMDEIQMKDASGFWTLKRRERRAPQCWRVYHSPLESARNGCD